jgi:hypothetical protein
LKRFNALEKLGVSVPSGLIESEITGSGTNMLVMDNEVEPSVKVSPDAHSIPKMAQISPGPMVSIS